MKNVDKLLEIEALTENVSKHYARNNLLRIKVLYFIEQYQNLPVSMIIEKLGIKKSNFALVTKNLEAEGLISMRQAELDKRCRMLCLTEKGKKELSDFLNNFNQFFGDGNTEVYHAIETLLNYLNKKI